MVGLKIVCACMCKCVCACACMCVCSCVIDRHIYNPLCIFIIIGIARQQTIIQCTYNILLGKVKDELRFVRKVFQICKLYLNVFEICNF